MEAMTYIVYITLTAALLILPAIAVALFADGKRNRSAMQAAPQQEVKIPTCTEAANDWLDRDEAA